MAEIKTKAHDQDVFEFINAYVENEQKRMDSFKLIELMETVSGSKATMWGTTMIGFGVYHYQSERSKQQGDWPLIGFSPRKSAISLYVYTGEQQHEYLLEHLGKYTKGKACIYVKKLSNINEDVLMKIMRETIRYLQSKYPIQN